MVRCVTFRVTSTSGYTITVGPTSYVKATVLGSVGIPPSRIFLSHRDTNTGPYSLSIGAAMGLTLSLLRTIQRLATGGSDEGTLCVLTRESHNPLRDNHDFVIRQLATSYYINRNSVSNITTVAITPFFWHLR